MADVKVLMLSWEYPPNVVGGLGKHVTELLPQLTRQGCEVHLVTPRCQGGDVETHSENLHVYRVEPCATAPSYFAGVRNTNTALRDRAQQLVDEHGDFNVVHAHDWLVSAAAVLLKHQNRLPLIATIHATEYGRNHGYLTGDTSLSIHNDEWLLSYEAWHMIACSHFMAQEIAAVYRLPFEKITVIPNGVVWSRFDAIDGEDHMEFRRRFARDDERIVFFVGRIVAEKGPQLLVEAAPRVLATLPETRFVIAGTGPMLPNLRERARQLGVADRVTFTGFISDDDRDILFKVADVAVFPSLYEPFGIVALEAMAARTPAVVSDVGGLSEVVEHDRTGVRVYPDNVESLVWGILHTLEHPDWARRRVENARHEVEEKYGWWGIAAQTKAVYERVVAERKESKW